MTDGMRTLQLLTCIDQDFEEFACGLRTTVASYDNVDLVIYDIDTRTPEKMASAQYKARVSPTYKSLDCHNNIIANHKPACILDFLDRTGAPCLCIDADCLLTGRIDLAVFEGADLCITPRGVRESKAHHLRNGLLNSGVVFFANNERVRSFVAEWHEACMASAVSDQKALSDLLEGGIDFSRLGDQSCRGMTVRLLDPEVYNDTTCRTGIIFHCKSVGRLARKYVAYRLLLLWLKYMPRFASYAIGLNRRYRWIVYRQRG